MTFLPFITCTVFITCTTAFMACAVFIIYTIIMVCTIFMTCTTIMVCAIFITCTTIIVCVIFMTRLTFMPFYLYYNSQPSWAFGGNITSNHSTNVAFEVHLPVKNSATLLRLSSTSTFLEDQHLLISFAKPTSTSTFFARLITTSILCEVDIYQYPLQSRHLLVSHVTRWRPA